MVNPLSFRTYASLVNTNYVKEVNAKTTCLKTVILKRWALGFLEERSLCCCDMMTNDSLFQSLEAASGNSGFQFACGYGH